MMAILQIAPTQLFVSQTSSVIIVNILPLTWNTFIFEPYNIKPNK